MGSNYVHWDVVLSLSCLIQYIYFSDGTADTDGWLTMTVHDGGFKHTAQKAEYISKCQSLPFLLVAGRSVGCFYMVQQPWFLVSVNVYLRYIFTIYVQCRLVM